MMTGDKPRVLFPEAMIKRRVTELAAEITRDYAGREPLLIGVLTGAFVFLSDLCRAIDLPCQVDFLSAKSYGKKSESDGTVRLAYDINMNIEDRDVLVVEDILDSGVTLGYIIDLLKVRHPASLNLCVLLDKPARRRAPVQAHYVGFTIPDEFVVGYGLDYAEAYRTLPYIGRMKP